ncbi:hypothetical protein EDB83DRAFT_2438945, partial [Lactarius deliciosus]
IYVRSLMVIYLPAHTVARSAIGSTGTTCWKKPKLRTLRDSRMARHHYVLRGHEIGTRACLELVNVETTPPGPSRVSRR